MGGAYTPANQSGPPVGNIDTGLAPGANQSAEWNAYWDPFAVKTVLESGVPLNIFPLNVTNSVVLTPEIISTKLLPESDRYAMLDLAAQMYSLVAFQTGFSFWDSVTTAFIDRPELFTMTPMTIDIDTSGNPARQGTMTIDPDGHPVQMATGIDVEGFYIYLVEQLKKIEVACWPPPGRSLSR